MVDTPFLLPTRAKTLDLSERVHLMGILNATPDSFSDGGLFISPEAAVARAEEMAEEGVDIIDVGGESSRPGAQSVPLKEELERVVPIVEILAARFPHIPISVDTTKAEVARQCLEEGASLINDISALRSDPAMAAVLKEHEVPVVLMHMQGTPRDMQEEPAYKDVVAEVKDFFKERLVFCAREIPRSQMILDPGIGFGKTLEHNLALLRGLSAFADLGSPILVGTSRKSFLGQLLARDGEPAPSQERGEGTVASGLWAATQGARFLRVHEVAPMRKALAVWGSLTNHGVHVI